MSERTDRDVVVARRDLDAEQVALLERVLTDPFAWQLFAHAPQPPADPVRVLLISAGERALKVEMDATGVVAFSDGGAHQRVLLALTAHGQAALAWVAGLPLAR